MSKQQMATYTLTIQADSGYESTTEGRCTAEQEPVGVVNIESHSTHGWKVADFELTKALPFGRHLLYTSPPARKPLTAREIELIDGMIEVQLDHAARCDNIPNRVMAEKQKGWDMERVELLRKLKENT